MNPNPSAAPVSKTRVWVGRGLSGLLVLFLLVDGVMKLVPPQPVIEASAELGISESTVFSLGILLLVCTVLYAIPRTAVPGAILLTGYLGGAIATHVRVGGPAFSIVFASLLGVLVWLGLYLREPRLHALIPIRHGNGR